MYVIMWTAKNLASAFPRISRTAHKDDELAGKFVFYICLGRLFKIQETDYCVPVELRNEEETFDEAWDIHCEHFGRAFAE